MTDRIAEETYAERARLATLLEGLEPAQWATPSLCAGWRVRDVVAHITMPFRTSVVRLVAGLVRARFSFDRYADLDARAHAARTSDGELVSLLRDNVRHPWRPPGGGQAGALSHDVIHGLDVTEPLGLDGPPPSRIELVLRHAGKRNLDHFGVDLGGTQLAATDADIAVGDGATRRMPAKDVLLVVTGRRALAEVPGENG
ncbi:maleylpyruvate isomerase family mycothiol-dependent enzyme [Haloechinothrix salitolerans]|uniref:Maleylpyruvate isomerase family mycothiol-dependent enzyme n=1 Tax=Haloechinothrix salitolerans TaxID=926830 RepID=A0ABW2BYW0_9PSEU